MRPMAAACVLVLGIPAVAALAQDVKVTHEPGTDFSRYPTFDWVETQEPVANPVNHVLITRAVEGELAAKGIEKVAEGKRPSLRVRYYAKIEKKLRASGRQRHPVGEPTNLRTTVDFARVEEGTILVELYDDETRLTLWRGTVTATAPRPDEVQEAIDDAVKRLFADFPPKAD
jgi:Domain of unknown function (DUF4136)